MKRALASMALGAFCAAGASCDERALPAQHTGGPAARLRHLPVGSLEASARLGGGAFRTWCRRPHASGSNVSEVAVAVAGNGSAAMAWIDIERAMMGHLRIAQELTQGRWGAVEPAALLEGSSAAPRLAPEGARSFIAVWQQRVGEQRGIYHARSDDSGVWHVPQGRWDALSGRSVAHDPHLATAPSGDGVVVWSQENDAGIGLAAVSFHARRDAILGPSSPDDVVSPRMFFTNEGRVAVGSTGAALATWYQSVGQTLRVFAAERPTGAARFSHPEPADALSPPVEGTEGSDGRYLGQVVPAVSRSGAAAVAWAQPLAGGQVAILMASRDRQGSWRVPSGSDDAFYSGDGIACCPRLAFLERGDLLVVWLEQRAAESALYLAHRAPSGVWLADGKRPIVLSSSPSASSPVLAAAHDTALVVWLEARAGAGAQVLAQRIHARQTGLEPPAPLSNEGDGEASLPVAAIGGPEDRALVAWLQAGRAHVTSHDATCR